MRVIDHIIKSVRESAEYNPVVEKQPHCILWPDKDRQWLAVIPELQRQCSELYVLGNYKPEEKMGPAIWLRCVLSGALPDHIIQADKIIIIYMPGISRQDIRAVETCPDHLKPIAELQFRGVIWSQLNAKDWTIMAFLISQQGGLGLDVTQDGDIRVTLQRSLTKLININLEELKGKHLDQDYFNALLTEGDSIRDMLTWLNQGDEYKNSKSEPEWKAFVELCKTQYRFNPEKEGIINGLIKFAKHESAWKPVWTRYSEAPACYENIFQKLNQCQPPDTDMFSNSETHGSWPQWNSDQENKLRVELKSLADSVPPKARELIIDLEKIHHSRRSLVWTRLGFSPLVEALEYLVIIAEKTNILIGGDLSLMVKTYEQNTWLADDAMLRMFNVRFSSEDNRILIAVLKSIYIPWMQDNNLLLQQQIAKVGYPGKSISQIIERLWQDGDCVFFVDGLRLDVARQLSGLLIDYHGYSVSESLTWAALPSITQTGKPAVSPINKKLIGEDINSDFEPVIAETRQSIRGGYQFKKLLEAEGWQILSSNETGDVNGKAWCEYGNIDHEGHQHGLGIVAQLDRLLREIQLRIIQLLEAGWKRIVVVTDHGWLLAPGGLPKVELSSELTDNKWGRCASIKPGAQSKETLYPWFWNPEQHFALAPGIACYRNNTEYAHGGISFQECLLLELCINNSSITNEKQTFFDVDVFWKGLRCRVEVEGITANYVVDLRLFAGDPTSSVISVPKAFTNEGFVSVIVEDDDLEGKTASVVILNDKKEIVRQIETIIGGDL